MRAAQRLLAGILQEGSPRPSLQRSQQGRLRSRCPTQAGRLKTAGWRAGVSTAAAAQGVAVRRMPPGRRRLLEHGPVAARGEASAVRHWRGAGPRLFRAIRRARAGNTACRPGAEADASEPVKGHGRHVAGVSPAARQSVPNAVSADLRPSGFGGGQDSVPAFGQAYSGSFRDHSRRA